MTPVNLTKKLIASKLRDMGVKYSKITAKTVSFEDLARESKIFITIHDFEGGLVEAERILTKNGTSAIIHFKNPKYPVL